MWSFTELLIIMFSLFTLQDVHLHCSMFIHIVAYLHTSFLFLVLHSFLWLQRFLYMDIAHLFMHSSVDGYLSCFCILAIGNHVALLNVELYKRITVAKVMKRQLIGLVAFYQYFSPHSFSESWELRIFHSSECQQLKMPVDDEASEDDPDSVSSDSERTYTFK